MNINIAIYKLCKFKFDFVFLEINCRKLIFQNQKSAKFVQKSIIHIFIKK